MIQLKSRWAEQVNKTDVHPEYPRPNLVRDSFFNLNGEWEYCINENVHLSEYDGTILVPFSPESFLSGVQKTLKPKEFLHYRKCFVLPDGFQTGRVLLHFGAVDQECIVYMNGRKVGTHRGGYLAFHFDVTEYLQDGENELTVCVRDMTEESSHARGKQKVNNKGSLSSLFYTPQSGIWKTVWMESVPELYVEQVQITPLYDECAVRVHVCTKDCRETERLSVQEVPKACIRVLDGETLVKHVTAETDQDVTINLGEFQSWTPDTPHLYDLEITVGNDTVTSYFGMRKFHMERDEKGILRFFMNNRPFFFNGVLDQGYWPESLMTPPTDEALRYDIVKLKELGFNMIRKHVKVESDRFYYHCDKEGMVVWQDMPNGGGNYNMLLMTYMPNISDWCARHVKDSHYGMFKRTSEEGRKQYYKDLHGMIRQLYNYPSIAVWVPFNEGWGQFDAKKATELVRQWDSTRLINEACGWFDQGGGDMYSIHSYFKPLRVRPQKDRAVALTEYGGCSFAIPGHIACEKEFGYKSCKSKEALTTQYRKLWKQKVCANLKRGLSAACYTQTSDIEEEINGIFTYDREEVKFLEAELKEMNRELYQMWNEMMGGQ